MTTTLGAAEVEELAAGARAADRELRRRFPGTAPGRQPVHTVYGGAHLFRHDSAARLGDLARRALAAHAPDPESLAGALAPAAAEPGGVAEPPSGHLVAEVYRRVGDKLAREPVEDFRIDFEDGYGHRADSEEDGHAEAAAQELAKGMAGGTLPPFVGIRIKPLSDELAARSIRTLDLVLTTLVAEGDGRLPDGFVVTLPKVTAPEQPALLARLLARLEESLGLAAGAVPLELMVETPQSVLAPDGRTALPALVAAAEGRCRGAHFGTYDYTASLAITADEQRMDHPVCDFAKHQMQVALAGTGVWLSDGATNVLPVAPHKPAAAAGEGGESGLTAEQEAENRRTVHAAWRLHYRHVLHSLVGGYYQGWDLHPAQLPTRYAAVYTFFLRGLDGAAARLANFVEQAARATLVGDVFDDAATGQGLLNYFLRALNCGAVSENEVRARTGLTSEELASRSFPAILAGRRRGRSAEVAR